MAPAPPQMSQLESRCLLLKLGHRSLYCNGVKVHNNGTGIKVHNIVTGVDVPKIGSRIEVPSIGTGV